LRRQNQP
jgi:hypothetical protein